MSVTKQDILDGFRRLGIRSGGMYVMHSSLGSLGRVDGGADAVVDAMLESVAPGGTVFAPTMTFGEPFDSTVTPSRCGLITETFRKRPDAIRSLSPTHSIAGIGPAAGRMLAGHDRTLPYGPNGPGSPIARLADEGGSVMLLGVTHTSNTALHIALYLAGLPFLKEWREVEVTGHDGAKRIVRVQHPGCSLGFDAIEPYLTARGAQTIITIGNAEVRYRKARDVIDIGLEALKENPALLLCNRPDCRFCAYTREKLC